MNDQCNPFLPRPPCCLQEESFSKYQEYFASLCNAPKKFMKTSILYPWEKSENLWFPDVCRVHRIEASRTFFEAWQSGAKYS